jgi:hypothetical protein
MVHKIYYSSDLLIGSQERGPDAFSIYRANEADQQVDGGPTKSGGRKNEDIQKKGARRSSLDNRELKKQGNPNI